MKPSEITLHPVPLVDTFGRAELEHAAAVLVRVCQVSEDRWQPISFPQLQTVMRTELANGSPPFAQLVRNPFFHPCYADLVDSGWATRHEDGAIELTEAAIAQIVRKHGPRCPACPHAPHPGACPEKRGSYATCDCSRSTP